MSMSKEQTTVDAEPPRRPKCTRCRHHGIIVPQKGHMKSCPFLKCDCWKCYLITQRTQLTALQRNLRKAHKNSPNKERAFRAGVRTAEGDSTSPDPGSRQAATFGPMSPLSDGAPERDAPFPRSPLDLRSKASREGETAARMDGGQVRPFASSEEAPCPRFNGLYFGECGQSAPLPFIHFPFRMSSHHPSSFAPCPNPLLNIPWFPPTPAGLYSNGLPGPLMLSQLRPHAVHYPPPGEPAPPADCRQVFFTLQPPRLPEPLQEELMYRQHQQPPLNKQTDQDMEEL
ncbi:doublesex- and mab-3-related transcription factor B1-like [Centropristis striata]|uniref:doublesex- and mab-3-related transcription factor B1-like n=1 Tax=Centropristis striata TaxID=184440 RepID=UPI0027E10A96|nr:doublesex- and mab-3-related transcription factor B1-like [Centropristis striata]